MGKSRGVVSVQDGVNGEDVVAIGVIKVALVEEVVEVGQVFREEVLVLTMLQHILLLEPVPRLVDLAKVLHNQAVFRNALLAFTKDSKTLGVYSEEGIIFARAVLNSIVNNNCKLLLKFREGECAPLFQCAFFSYL